MNTDSAPDTAGNSGPADSTGAAPATSDLHVAGFQPLISPHELLAELPLAPAHAALVQDSRDDVRRVLAGEDDRLVVVVGPCSVHDPAAALEYAQRLAPLAAQLRDDLVIVMRVYFEKPRTTVGWKGLINDPHLDGSFDVHTGLRMARRLLLDVLDLGLPVGCEFLDPTSPQYIADTATWGAIGARTSESQVHRQLASGLSMPVGFKNATDGNVQVAIDACHSALGGHVFFGVDDAGRAAIVTTTGNPDAHVILRGGRSGPNYGEVDIADALALLEKAGRPQHLVVDASHGNSGKDHVRQAVVAAEIGAQIAAGEKGIAGVMLESFLLPGRQEIGPDMVYGRSVTDACMAWDTTETVLAELAESVRARRG
jgi:3-deoxy-7-phosphoheptulonate synthase